MNNVKTNEEPKLSWEVVVDQFKNLIKFASKQQAERGIDGMLSAEDLYQEGMIKLYDCWLIWCVDKNNNKDMDEFGPIFRKSLFRMMPKAGNTGASKPVCVDLEDEAMENILMAEGTTEDIIEKMYMEEGLAQLKDMLDSNISKELLEELIEPSERTLFEAVMDIKRKEMIKSQGKRVNIPKDTTVRMKHIMRALGITTKQYDMAMAEIRGKASLVIER